MKNLVIIPTYNESSTIVDLVTRVFNAVPDVSIMVVDDNSPDRTGELVQALTRDFPNLKLLSRGRKEGLGRAYMHAFSEALKQDLGNIITMDADLSHDPACLPKMLQEAQTADIVIGSRYISGGKTIGWELWRRLLSRFASFYCRLITKMPTHDCTSGFMTINSNFLRKIDFSSIDLSGYAFLIELKYLLWKKGASIKEIPITFKNRAGGESKISNHIIKEGILAPWKMILKK